MAEQRRDIIVLGGSEGSNEAFENIWRGIDPKLPASLFVVRHVASSPVVDVAVSLAKGCPLPCRQAKDGDQIKPGQVLVAPQDQHMVISDGAVRLECGPRENFVRPSIDVLFRSAAYEYGPRVIAVLLSGLDSDGLLGSVVVKSRGGRVIIQNPSDASSSELPSEAVGTVEVDSVLPAGKIGAALMSMANDPSPAAVAGPKPDSNGVASVFTCPECDGPLHEFQHGRLMQYKCEVGHSFEEGAMEKGEDAQAERALWSAMRHLQSHAEVLERIANRMEGVGRLSAEAYRKSAIKAREDARAIARMLHRGKIGGRAA